MCGHANAIPINNKFINEYDESIFSFFCRFWSYSTNIAMTFSLMSEFWLYYNVTSTSDEMLKIIK